MAYCVGGEGKDVLHHPTTKLLSHVFELQLQHVKVASHCANTARVNNKIGSSETLPAIISYFEKNVTRSAVSKHIEGRFIRVSRCYM